MARMKKNEVIDALNAKGVEIPDGMGYNDLCKLLKGSGDEPVIKPRQIKLTNKIPKRRMFLADSIRNERDTEFLNRELRKREHKGKVTKVVTTKHYDVIDGNWLTEFIIDLKE